MFQVFLQYSKKSKGIILFVLLVSLQVVFVTPIFPTQAQDVKDPFKDASLIEKVKRATQPVTPVAYPNFTERAAQWQLQVEKAEQSNSPVPELTEKYLIAEIESVSGMVVGKNKVKFAIIRLKNTKNTVMVKQGSRFFNGSILMIEQSASGSKNGSLRKGVRISCLEEIPTAPGEPKLTKVVEITQKTS